jgi:hypothetical protein
MSFAIGGSAGSLYSPAADAAVSSAGAEIRGSLETALTPTNEHEADETTLLLTRISAALRKGMEHEGVLVDVAPFGRMFDLLQALPVGTPLPEIVVESDHEIGLDWGREPRRVLSVTVDNTSYLGYAALIGFEPIHGRVPFAGSLPDTLAYLLSRVYPSTDINAAS